MMPIITLNWPKKTKSQGTMQKYNDCDVRDSDTKKAILEQLFGKK